MSIEVVAAKEQGEKYKAVIFSSEVQHGDPDATEGFKRQDQLKVKLIEPSGGVEVRYLPIPMTEKNRTGRWFKALTGKYPVGTVDEKSIEGLPVFMIYGPKFRAADETVLDAVKLRDPDKGEDPIAIANAAKEADDMEAPF